MALSTISGTTGITDATITSAKLADFTAAVDLNGVELLLDADADTSISADTDDRIDFKIANTDHFSLSSSSGDTVFKSLTDAKDLIFQQFDGNKVLEINDSGFVGIGGNSNASGEIRIFEDTDNGNNYVGLSVGNVSTAYTLTFPNADGSNGQALVTNGSGTLSFGDVISSTAADDIQTGDAAVTLATSAGNITIDAQGNDTDIIFKGTDGSSDTTFLTLDGSAAGAASFNGAITANAGVVIDNITIDGTEIDLSSGDLTLDVAGDIILDADGADVIFQDAGTEYGRVTNSSTDFIIQTAVSDKDFIIKGNDGGSTITPFTLDMSAGGDLFLTGGLIDLKNDGSAVSQIKFYCESSNAHAQTLQGAPHSESASNVLTLPSTGGNVDLVSTASTATLTNKTLTTPVIAEIDSGSSASITLDSEVDIVLDADGGDVFFKDGGTTIATLTNSSSDFVVTAGVQDKDIIFKGDDGGSAITSLTLDMSNAGAAIFSAAAYNAEATLTDASTISWNAITQPVAKVTLGANRTLGAASGGVAGAFISLLIIQDGTGSRTVSFNAAYEFAEDTAPTLTTTASKGDLFVFRYNGSKWLEVGRNLNLTLS